MKVKELKEILGKMDDDCEIYVSPLIEVATLTKDGLSKDMTLTPSPYDYYAMREVAHVGLAQKGGSFSHCLMMCYEQSGNLGEISDGENEPHEFIN